jgi:hypothetical protein
MTVTATLSAVVARSCLHLSGIGPAERSCRGQTRNVFKPYRVNSRSVN